MVEPSIEFAGCKYLGGEYDEGDVICHKGGEWRCEGVIWVDQNKPC
ncbi:MAG: hypothetical protein Q7U72_07460 [Brevundimonas sp.]|nr:hypothetical protein [Brevundimonas sp.]MDO9077273.1 hypothetical protein [Brevundimonas sp.]MDP3081505.1 hypothetical protein [Brevundimonas sp.]MDZ4060379.1 hypothetical protein [Brevundimonas sp.]